MPTPQEQKLPSPQQAFANIQTMANRVQLNGLPEAQALALSLQVIAGLVEESMNRTKAGLPPGEQDAPTA